MRHFVFGDFVIRAIAAAVEYLRNLGETSHARDGCCSDTLFEEFGQRLMTVWSSVPTGRAAIMVCRNGVICFASTSSCTRVFMKAHARAGPNFG